VSSQAAVSGGLASIRDLAVHPPSVVAVGDAELGLSRAQGVPRLAVLAPADGGGLSLERFEGDRFAHGDRAVVVVGPAVSHNLDALRAALPWLVPRTLGLRTSAGLGDRLGLATPGHVRALRAVGPGAPAPVFAQQSIRELDRTGREPEEVLDAAAWGAFAEGWRDGFGADADHLKTPADVDRLVEAGYTFFTFDPGDHVDDRAEDAAPGELRPLFEELPWEQLEDTPGDLIRRRAGLDEASLVRAAVKYGRAVAHACAMFRHLEAAAAGADFEVEVSIDETATPTTPAQHRYIALELRRLGVRWVSLAPRFVGRFEKGIDYIGDLNELEADFAAHGELARELGPYKLSLHSGSDKFSAYPAAMRQTDGMVHLKTAGTSYLAALRAVAALDPAWLRRVYALARDRFEEDRASYDLSARLERAPEPAEVADAELPALVDQADARQALHVTFGSVLGEPALRSRLMELLRENPDVYAAELEAHFVRHLEPFRA
jgi:hypothetical protein